VHLRGSSQDLKDSGEGPDDQDQLRARRGVVHEH
jgi:hypothetical protein